MARRGFEIVFVAVELDAAAGDHDGLFLLKELKEAGSALAIALAPTPDMSRIRATMRLGAHGFILYDEITDRLIRKTIKHASHRDLAAVISRDFGTTTAETAVLRELLEGLTNGQIASRLGLSLETIRSHMKRIFVKLKVSSRVQALLKMRGHRSGNVQGTDLTVTPSPPDDSS
jgi:DNA-binding NarL/FixJ family response regulator